MEEEEDFEVFVMHWMTSVHRLCQLLPAPRMARRSFFFLQAQRTLPINCSSGSVKALILVGGVHCDSNKVASVRGM